MRFKTGKQNLPGSKHQEKVLRFNTGEQRFQAPPKPLKPQAREHKWKVARACVSTLASKAARPPCHKRSISTPLKPQLPDQSKSGRRQRQGTAEQQLNQPKWPQACQAHLPRFTGWSQPSNCRWPGQRAKPTAPQALATREVAHRLCARLKPQLRCQATCKAL